MDLGTLVIAAALMNAPKVRSVTLFQTVPVSKTFVWDPVPDPCLANDPTSLPCPVTSYTVTLDGTVIGSPAGTSQPFTLPTVGKHTLTVAANNMWTTSPAAVLVVNVQAPGKPGNGRIQ